MPICINPDCGKTSQKLTPLCAYCGQATLYAIDKTQTGTSQNREISMELFEAEVSKYPAKAERELRSKRPKFLLLPHLKRSRQTFKVSNAKKVITFIVFVSFIALTTFMYVPASFKNEIADYLRIREKIPTDFNQDENQFKFLYVAESGLPAYLKGCETIPYYIRRSYATSEDLELVKVGLDRIGDAYGRSFTFAGFTKETEVSKLPSSFLINFTTLRESKELRKASKAEVHGVLGIGGPEQYDFIETPRFGSQYFDRGSVQINGDEWPKLTVEAKVALIMHEAGHVFGLDHPRNGVDQLMTGEPVPLTASFGNGDLKGLRILSAVAGCRKFPKYLRD